MKMLQEDIKNQSFKKVYLLFGPEAYLRTQYKCRLRDALIPSEDTMNQAFFQGKDCNPREIIDLAETLPFFAPRRYIGVEDSGFFANKCEELIDYLPQMPESTCLVFVEAEVKKNNRLYKLVKDLGRAVEFLTPDEKSLIQWILGQIHRDKKRVTEQTLHLFLEKTGTDMENISQELEKLLSYCMDKDIISSEDVEAICTTQITNKIFDMINAIAERRQKQALDLYYDLLTLKESPRGILALLARQFNQLLAVRNMMGLGHTQGAIASRLSLSPYIAGKCMKQARRFTTETLAQAVKDCVQAQEDVNTGRMGDVLSVELLLVKYSS